MSNIEIINSNLVNLPYQVFVCDVYGNQCVLVANINLYSPPTIPITIPTQFDNAPAVGIKIIDSLNCEKFKIYDCQEQITVGSKQFMDGENFYFMDDIIYDFQN